KVQHFAIGGSALCWADHGKVQFVGGEQALGEVQYLVGGDGFDAAKHVVYLIYAVQHEFLPPGPMGHVSASFEAEHGVAFDVLFYLPQLGVRHASFSDLLQFADDCKDSIRYMLV